MTTTWLDSSAPTVRGLANDKITTELALPGCHRGGPGPRRAGGPPDASRRRSSGGTRARPASSQRRSSLAWPPPVDVHDVGVTDSAVAFLTADMDAHFGVMLSPRTMRCRQRDQVLRRRGTKLPDAVEDEIAALYGQDWTRPVGARSARAHSNRAGQGAVCRAPPRRPAQPSRRTHRRHRRRARRRTERGLPGGVFRRRRRCL